jgi:hypothetical protein
VRWTADLDVPMDGVVRLMLYEVDGAVWLFLYDRAEDAPCFADEWYGDIESARNAAAERFGVELTTWTWIPDPRVGDRDDLIAPRRAAAEGCG